MSKISEFKNIINYTEFNEPQIIERNKTILDKFFEHLRIQGLLTFFDSTIDKA
jgi:hypothetical protein